jgi:hypothetical protein
VGVAPRTAEGQSALAVDDAAFAAAYPLTHAGPQAVTEHALFPAMSAVESLHTAGILVARRKSHRQPHIAEVLQLCRVAMECAALTIWLLNDPSSEVRRDRCMSEEMEQLEQQGRYLKIGEEDETGNPARYRRASRPPAHPLSAQRSTCSSQLPAVSDLALIRHPKEAFRLEQLVAE